MAEIALVLVALSATVCALAGWGAAAAARDAVARMGLERRRDHWARVSQAVVGVDRSASAYSRAIGASMERVGADRTSAERDRAVIAAAVRYQDACGRLTAALSAGPEPTGAGPWLEILLDGARPEDVVASGAGRRVLAELSRLQAELDRPTARPHRRRPTAVVRARAARARSTWRLVQLGRSAGRG